MVGCGVGLMVNALEAVKEFKDGHDDVQLIFDGAGPKWLPELEKRDHKLHGLYAAVKNRISGACEFCAEAFSVKDKVVACGVKLAGVRRASEFQKAGVAGVSGHYVLAALASRTSVQKSTRPDLRHGSK